MDKSIFIYLVFFCLFFIDYLYWLIPVYAIAAEIYSFYLDKQ